jgi:molybdenum cofactor synthesis domain-containing protein
MSSKAEVVSVNVSADKGTVKRPVGRATVDRNGIVGDAHAGPWHRQLSLLSQETIDRFAQTAGLAIEAGDFGENLTVRGLNLGAACLLDGLRIGDVDLQVTQIGKACHGESCAIYRQVGRCVMPTDGIFCRVLQGGTIEPGAAVEHLPRSLRFRIITLSDRAFRGDYADRSGPRICELLEQHLAGTRWRPGIESTVLPDDAPSLGSELSAARDDGVDVVFTTGGTGVGPRDITPETVTAFCDKLIPGIMEMIRVRFGADKPNALLSRGVAGVSGRMLVYTLPGSVRAVEEYMGEILKTMEHLILVLHGVDAH